MMEQTAKWTADNWWVGPGRGAVEALAMREGISTVEAAERLLRQREEWIEQCKDDPVRFGYEPPIWWVVWALMDFPWCQQSTARYLAGRLGVAEDEAWQVFKVQMRKTLGFADPVRDVLIMGANRSSKTNFAACTMQRWAMHTQDEMGLFLAQQFAVSTQTVQPRLWEYMPKEWRVKHMGEDWYVNYKDLKGFSEAQYQMPSGCKMIGKFYSQDPKDALVGCEARMAWADEEIPLHWMEELGRRLASRRGQMIATFTPVSGYTPPVKMFQDGSSVVRTCTGYMLPRDGKDPWPWAAVGLSREEWGRRLSELKEKRLSTVPAARPEDCVAWIQPEVGGPMSEVGGRMWEEVPRVARCFDARQAIVWFQAGDNPYGEPLELIARETGKPADRIRTIIYGIAVKSRSSVFASYNEKVHAVGMVGQLDGESAGRSDHRTDLRGVKYCLMDPAGDRNYAIAWINSTPTQDCAYREWPGNYHIPGVGVPGPWAKGSGKNKGWNDGARDEGQESFGFGLIRMKYEIARLEGWRDYEEWAREHDAQDIADGIAMPSEEEVKAWDEEHGTREKIEGRFIDSRPASSFRIENDRPVTLLTQLNDLGGWYWNTTPGDDIADGLAMIVSALAYIQDASGMVMRAPEFVVHDCCRNIRFALATYTGADGQKGAVKDWIDLLRYFFRQGLALCKEADPMVIAREFGGRRMEEGKRNEMVGAGGMVRSESVRAGVSIREGWDGGAMVEREVVRAGGVVSGRRGGRAVWRGIRGVRT